MTIRPQHLHLDKDRGLTIQWADDDQVFYPIAYLRRMSPSADARALRDEMKKNPLTVLPTPANPDAGPLHATAAEMVGNYALRIIFSDGHDTGIYSWDYLNQIRPEQASAEQLAQEDEQDPANDDEPDTF